MIKLVAKADSFKKSAREKKKTINEYYCSTIQKMEEELTSVKKKVFMVTIGLINSYDLCSSCFV